MFYRPHVRSRRDGLAQSRMQEDPSLDAMQALREEMLAAFAKAVARELVRQITAAGSIEAWIERNGTP